MTTNYHTALPTGEAANSANVNAPLAGLDAALTNLDARLDAVEAAGYSVVTGNVATLSNGAAAGGQKSITVDSSAGFLVGGRIGYVRNDGQATVEYNTLAAIPDATHLTCADNLGSGGIADNSYISLIPASEYQATQSTNHDSGYAMTLQRALVNGGAGVRNALNYGARGDGTTDDSTALAAAISAANAGDTVLLPPGRTFRANITLNKAITLLGEGATLLAASSGGTAPLTVSGAGARVRGLTVKPQGSFWGPLCEVTGADVTVENCVFDGSAASGDYSSALYVNGGARAVITGNRVLGTNGATRRGWIGIDVINGANARICGNYVSGGRAYGIDIHNTPGQDNATGGLIDGNVVESTAAHGILSWSSRTRITNNTVRATGGTGIFLSGDPEGGGGTNYGSVVAGNTVLSPTATGITLEYGVRQFAITGNTVRSAGTHGISVTKNSHYGTITGNAVDAAAGSYGGIVSPYDTAGCTYLTITGNIISNCAQKGVHLESCQKCTVAANQYYNNAGGNVSYADTSSAETFADGELNPSVASNAPIYRMNNATTWLTVSNFDNGQPGQRITVLFLDSRTGLDFSGSHLKGNGGVDRTTTAGDFMTAVFDGTDWWCQYVDCTA